MQPHWRAIWYCQFKISFDLEILWLRIYLITEVKYAKYIYKNVHCRITCIIKIRDLISSRGLNKRWHIVELHFSVFKKWELFYDCSLAGKM